MNGNKVLAIVLNHFLADLIEFGTIELPPMKGTSNRDTSWHLKESAKQVTAGILAATTGKSLNSSAAVKQWYSLRHLATMVSSVVTKSG